MDTTAYKWDNNLGSNFLENACSSIRLSDISKKCVYNNGESKGSKNCLKLKFNGKENDIENICQAAGTHNTEKKGIISSDKTYCIEVDKSFIIEDNSNDNSWNNYSNEGNSNNNNNNNNNNQQGKTNNKDSGKNIYINSLHKFFTYY